MKGGTMLLDPPDKSCIIIKIVERVNAPDNVYFSNGLTVKFPDSLEHFVNAEFPGQFITPWPVIRTEPAVIDANISWLDVKIPVKACIVAVLSSSYNACKQGKGGRFSFFIKQEALARRDPGAGEDLFGNLPEVAIINIF